jgi:cell wall-associated NlpC family hydrolase
MSPGRHVGGLAAAAALTIPFLLAAGVALAAEASGAISPPPTAPTTSGCVSAGAAKAAAGTFNSTQKASAQIIYNVAVSLGLPQQAAVIAITTAMQESRLQNLPYGDADSIGLFQQRPSQGWGTPAQITDPVYAAKAFYNVLVRIPNWQSLPVAVAAQDVQRSANPGAYAQWQNLATALVNEFSGTASQCLTDNGLRVPATGTTHLPAGYSLPTDTPPAIQIAIGYALNQLGKPYIWGGTGPAGYDCSGLIMMAYRAAGIDLPRTTFQQVNTGTLVYSLSQLHPGDLLFTAGSDGGPTNPGHVGMYIGDGLIIQAPETGEPIMLTRVTGYWQQNTVAIRRIV